MSGKTLRTAPGPPVPALDLVDTGFTPEVSATSLPAFQYGYPFGQRPDDFEPCADLRVSYAACQDALGVDVMNQADANPGR
jgi:hypothetical protein